MQHSLNGKYSVLDDFCDTGFLAYYLFENILIKVCDYQPDEFDYHFLRGVFFPLSPLPQKNDDLRRNMRCGKVTRILPYHIPNKLLTPETFTHYMMLLLFCSELKNSCCQVVHHSIKIYFKNEEIIKSDPDDDLDDETFSQFNDNLINYQDQPSQIENKEYASEDTETNKTSAISNFMLQILPDNEIAKGINSLNSKQREVFNVVYTWAKDYVKYYGHDVESLHILLSGSGVTGKSHLLKVIYNEISKTLLYHRKDPDKPKILFLKPRGI